MLEQLLSREVADVSAQMPESVEELRKALEQKDQQLEAQQLENQALRKDNEETAKRIKVLEALVAKK